MQTTLQTTTSKKAAMITEANVQYSGLFEYFSLTASTEELGLIDIDMITKTTGITVSATMAAECLTSTAFVVWLHKTANL